MNKHRGDIVRGCFYDSGITVRYLATELDVSTKTIYNWFNTRNLDIHKIKRIGKVILHDFSQEFKELQHENQYQLPESVSRVEEPGMENIGKRQVTLTVDLDGSEELLNHWISVMKTVNASLSVMPKK